MTAPGEKGSISPLRPSPNRRSQNATGINGRQPSSPGRTRLSGPRSSPGRTRLSGPRSPEPFSKHGVVLLNFGGPRTLEEVPAFLFEILSDPNTLQLPLPRWAQNILARRITRRRSVEMARQYGAIGGKSPLVDATAAIAESLRELLPDLPVYTVHRYLRGYTEAVAREIAAEGNDTDGNDTGGTGALLALPLYPHFSYATTGSSIEQLLDALDAAGWRGEVTALAAYPRHPRYLEALAARLEECLSAHRPPPGETVILCSAHGLPRSYVERGDPYRDQIEDTVSALRESFPGWRIEIAYQSRVGPAEWLRPYTDEIIPQLAAEGVRHLVFLPISFTSDHIETLYEVGVTYFSLARKCGMEPYRVQAVENHPGLIRLLADTALAWRSQRGGGGAGTEAGEAGRPGNNDWVPAQTLLPPGQTLRRNGGWIAALLLAAGIALGLAALLQGVVW